MKKFLSQLFNFKPKAIPAATVMVVRDSEPLDWLPSSKVNWGDVLKTNGFKDVSDFQIVPDSPLVMDSAVHRGVTMDNQFGTTGGFGPAVPDGLMAWYTASGAFPGYSALAIMAQHWLVDKACSMPPEDAIRHGYELSLPNYAGDASKIIADIAIKDKAMNIREKLVEAGRFTNIFGVRLCIFECESSDPKYYEKPFNIDGVIEGAYKGISQVDAQWVMPQLSNRGSSDPASKDFYEPEYWVISGKRYHKSHVVVLRGPSPPDILKPTYIFGGISLVQRIYEHVYDAERTSAEAPRLAMAKRTTTLKVDLAKVALKEGAFLSRLQQWIMYRDNFSVKVLGKDEEINETDTSLADLDDVIMTQYQVVAAISKIPSIKLMGTSPKGFSSGADELVNYHEELESIESRWYDPILTRHYMLLTKSYFGAAISVDISWNPVASASAETQSTVNKNKAAAGVALISAGVILPNEERDRLRADKRSGYALTAEEVALPLVPPTAPPGTPISAGSVPGNAPAAPAKPAATAPATAVRKPSLASGAPSSPNMAAAQPEQDVNDEIIETTPVAPIQAAATSIIVRKEGEEVTDETPDEAPTAADKPVFTPQQNPMATQLGERLARIIAEIVQEAQLPVQARATEAPQFGGKKAEAFVTPSAKVVEVINLAEAIVAGPVNIPVAVENKQKMTPTKLAPVKVTRKDAVVKIEAADPSDPYKGKGKIAPTVHRTLKASIAPGIKAAVKSGIKDA